MKMKNLKQKVIFSATPEMVFKAFLSSKSHSEFIGGSAVVSNKPNGKFKVWDGYAWGRNLKLEKNRLIVQEWEGMDFPKGHVSVCEFKLTPKGQDKCVLNFTQKNVPIENYADLSKGWQEYYWQPMEEFFKKQSKSS